jgi:hypothetical protein
MLQPIIENAYLVEVNLGTIAAQKQINFNFIPQLEGSQIYGIQVFSRDNFGTTPNGATTTTIGGIASLSVTFTEGDNQTLYQYPLYDLVSSANAGFQRMFNNKRLNLTKSFVTINSITGLANNESVVFLFHYRK